MMTKKELAEFLKVTTMTIDRYMAKGMPFIKLPTGTVRFEKNAVMEWVKGTSEEVN